METTTITKIVIPKWLRTESPICAGFCDLVNAALEEKPNLTLADFAQSLSETNMEMSMERIQKVERKQFGEDRV